MGIFKAVGFEPWTVKKTTLPTLHNDCIGFEIYDVNFLKLILAKKLLKFSQKTSFSIFKKIFISFKERWKMTENFFILKIRDLLQIYYGVFSCAAFF